MKDFSSPKNLSHFPVMLEEVLKICNPSKGGNFIDCTYLREMYNLLNILREKEKQKVTINYCIMGRCWDGQKNENVKSAVTY